MSKNSDVQVMAKLWSEERGALNKEIETLRAELAALKAPPADTAMDRYRDVEGGYDRDPVERLRFFCSLALSPQDWLDVEPFFDAITGEISALKAPPKVLSAEDVEEEGWYWSVDNEEFVQIDCDPTILPWQLSMWRVSSSVCSRLQGQFIGPIQMPEV